MAKKKEPEKQGNEELFLALNLLEKEKGILARIMAERDKLEEDRRDKELRIRHIQEDIGQRQIQGTTVFILKGCYSVLEGVRIRLEEIETELTRTQARAEKQRRVVTEASQEVKKLEKLKEKQMEEYRHEEAKEQQDLIIEHVAGTFVRNGVS